MLNGDKQAVIKYRITPGGSLQGKIRMPGDKSISHRSIMLGAVAEGKTEISGFLEGADCLATLQAFTELGVQVARPDTGKLTIHGVGLQGLKAPHQILDLGNSGTSIRLLTGLLAGQKFSSQLTGDASLQRRPMARVVDPLTAMGANIEMQANGCPPLVIHGGQLLRGIKYAMPIASAQVKSALLLAGLYATGETTIIEPAVSRDHTERMLAGFGYPIERKENVIRLFGQKKLTAAQIQIPGDISSAAFFLVGASIAAGSDLLLEQVGVNPTRTGVITILRAMGADITVFNEHYANGEPVADIRVRHAALRGITIPQDLVPLAIDEFPAIFIAAACAEGETVLQGAQELRVKESDRIQTMVEGLQICGIEAQAFPDGIRISGGQLQGGVVKSHGDHRIAMAFAMAGLCSTTEIIVADCANVRTSFPNFVELAEQVGLRIALNPPTP